MREVMVKVKFPEGLHARPAVQMIKTAGKYKARVTIEKKGKTVPADSIMAVLGACIVCGDEILIRAEFDEEDKAIEAMKLYFA